MFKTLVNAFKIKDIRKRIFYTFFMLIIVRLGCQIPVPGTDASVVAETLSKLGSGGAFGFFDALTGGSFSEVSIFALNITPYITSSIIVQLLTIAIPKLEEMQRDGEDGRKKLAEITRYLTVVLAIVEATAMSIGFGNQGLFGDLTGMQKTTAIITAVVAMTAGSTFLMWMGEQITEKGVGNGISIILLINIIARIPSDFATLFNKFVVITDSNGRSVGGAAVGAICIVVAILAVVAFVVLLQDGERRINVQYAKKMAGRKMIGGQSSYIPLKVNTAGVIPIIFASSLMQFPVVISQFFNADGSSVWGKIVKGLSTNNWCDPDNPIYSIGFLVYILLVIGFAYFYTSITFNPMEVSNNIKKQGGFVPGIRPGKPTTDYFTKILNYIIFIGACGLIIVAAVPIILSGVFDADVSFGGTSLIIIVGVVLETMKKIESMMLVRNYKGFLSE